MSNYHINVGPMLHALRGATFYRVTNAMEFADMMYDTGYSYAEVVDAAGNLYYTVEDRAPRTHEDREARKIRAAAFQKQWEDTHK